MTGIIFGNLCLIIIVLESTPVSTPIDVCYPSPCGPNSQCKVVSDQAVCSCLPEYIGAPPNCRPECVVSSECPQDKACIKQKCTNPCPGPCGTNTNCKVINHSPICSCKSSFTGDPFTLCTPIRCKLIVEQNYEIVMFSKIFECYFSIIIFF